MVIPPFAAELAPLLRQFCRGEYGIALGGAHAKGVDDAESDLDLYLFAREVLSIPEREALCAQFSLASGLDKGQEISGMTSWEEPSAEPGGAFLQGGTDFYYKGQKVEVWLRSIDQISSIISACQAGDIRRDYVVWTVMGFFNYCAMSDLDKMQPLEDPQGVLARWKAEVRRYPPAMKRRITHEYLAAARFWPGNFHYKTAVARCDMIYTSGIVQQVVQNLIQVIFALNEEYFPGEKKLGPALEHLLVKPVDFSARVQRLVFPGANPSREVLEAQRVELAALVEEVEALIDGSRGENDHHPVS